MACISSALIVGGGIAGMSAAIALARVGVRCDVVELADAPMGASIGISGRAAEALDALGVYDECHANGAVWSEGSTAGTLCDATGKVVSKGPPRPTWPGAKTPLGLYRPVLISALQAEATRLGVHVRRGLTTESVEEGADSVAVTLSNGERADYDLLIGADGIWSRSRTDVFTDAPKPVYAGQISIRWMAPGPAIQPEGWFMGPIGRMGFYHLPQGMIYVPAVLTAPEWTRPTKEQVYEMFKNLLDSYTAPSIVELRKRLTPESDLICRPFDWILVPEPWYRGRTLLVGDAAHATTAHMGMGGGMALEDAVVLGECIGEASTLKGALDAFVTRRFERVRTVVETSVALSHLEQENAPLSENIALLGAAFKTLAQPY